MGGANANSTYFNTYLDAKYVKKRTSWRTLKKITLWGYGAGIFWPHPMTMGGKTSYTVPMRHVNSSLGA